MAEMLSTQSIQEFGNARRQAFIRSVMQFFRLQPDKKLLPFDEIRSRLGLHHTRYLGVKNVELNKIVGSVGRYDDFTREFLPKNDSQEGRWRRIYDLTNSMEGFPPVDLYKIGDAYFVRDGNHRVSVAQTNQSQTIEAYVTEYLTPVDISVEDTFDDVLIKVGRVNFLETTRLNKLRPDENIVLTNPGRYKWLLANIARHKYFKEVEQSRELSYSEAVESWYDNVYMPLVYEIRERDILQRFPGRTEADLYAWLVLHRETLEEVYGLGNVDTDEIVDDLEEEATATPVEKLERAIKRKLAPASLPPAVE